MDGGSLDSALRQAGRTFARFPLVILLSLAGMAAALRFNHAPVADAALRAEALRWMLASWLGVSFLLSLALVAEGRRLNPFAAYGLQAAGLALLAAYAFTLHRVPYPIQITRFWLLMAASHLFLILAPALGRGADESDFWRFNLKVCSRAAVSLLHAGILLLGVTVALASVKNLFLLPIPDPAFLDPVLVVLGAFHTWYFLSGMPRVRAARRAAEPDAEPATEAAYPRTLKRAAQFILLPLMSVYLLILYIYALKALVTWSWPAGGGTWLILAFCGLGLFTLFLIHPLAAKADADGPGTGNWAEKWIRFFGRNFYPALIPLLALLFAAIGRRVHEYGLTENRYLVLAFAVWLSGMTLHTLIDRRIDMRILPASLGLVSLLAAYGPWGAFEVSRKSQVQRLQSLLERGDMLVGGKLAKAPGPVPREEKREIGAIAHYLEERRRLGDLSPWLPSLEDTVRTHPVVWFGALDSKFAFLQALELPYVPPSTAAAPESDALAFLCRACDNPLKRVTGFDLLLVDSRSESLLGEGRELPVVEPDGPQGLRLAFEPDSGLLRFSARDPAPDAGDSATGPGSTGVAGSLLDLDLGAYFQGLRNRYPDAYDLNLPEEEMILEREAERLKVRLRIRSMRGDMAEDSARLREFTADVFVQVKSRSRLRRAAR